MSKYLVAGALLAYTSAYANSDKLMQPHMANDTTIQWDVIGAYASDARKNLKFIKPVKDCLSTSDISADDDYLLQLHNCHQKRKGWLKI